MGKDKPQPLPLWKLVSGAFLGWRRGSDFFNINGERVGYFFGDKLYRDSDGVHAGSVHPFDKAKIGWRNGSVASRRAHRGTASEKIEPAPLPNVTGFYDAAWSDPNI